MVFVLFIIFLASAASYKPVPPIKCGVNEYPVPCKTLCPPQNCDIAYTDYFCDPNPKCIPGCDCIKNHLRNNEKICIFNEKCPGLSTLPEDIPNTPEPPKNTPTSNSSITASTQSTSKSASSISKSSLSSSSSSSSSSSQSSASSYTSSSIKGIGGEGPKRNCTYNRCTPTCSLEFPPNCPQDSNPCNCPPGTIISDVGGKCVPREECQKYANCKGDYNATYTDCPIACPSTCAKPNAKYCNTRCGNWGCACNVGYLLNKINGKCIKPEDCPGGNVCGKNETFVGCAVGCPTNYCPVEDSRAIIACAIAYPCPSGCSCRGNYLRKSVKEDICILASECPPVKCTRPNEEWNPCPEPCFSDYCSERKKVIKPGECLSYGPDCSPQCVCKQGFYRNETNICVEAQECPSDS